MMYDENGNADKDDGDSDNADNGDLHIPVVETVPLSCFALLLPFLSSS